MADKADLNAVPPAREPPACPNPHRFQVFR